MTQQYTLSHSTITGDNSTQCLSCIITGDTTVLSHQWMCDFAGSSMSLSYDIQFCPLHSLLSPIHTIDYTGNTPKCSMLWTGNLDVTVMRVHTKHECNMYVHHTIIKYYQSSRYRLILLKYNIQHSTGWYIEIYEFLPFSCVNMRTVL